MSIWKTIEAQAKKSYAKREISELDQPAMIYVTKAEFAELTLMIITDGIHVHTKHGDAIVRTKR